jgi:cytochrome P450
MERQIADLLAGRNMEAKNASHKTVFHEILSYNLPPEELTMPRLSDEALAIIAAGVGTRKSVLSVASYHILANQHIERRLRAELAAKIPDANHIQHWMELEKIPYLNNVVAEGA